MLEERKAEHLHINLEKDVSFPQVTTGLERYCFVHNALPELDLARVELGTAFLGKQLRLPLLISSMTGGTSEAQRINLHLAEGAQAAGIAMGLGSLRAALEAPHLADTFRVRHLAPDVLLFANLGAVQLNTGVTVDDCRRAVDLVEADALILHLNPLQEALQAEGDTNWAGLLDRIAAVCRSLDVPVVAKEVGWGISAGVARRLADAGVEAVVVSNHGGRQLDAVPSTAAALPAVAEAVGDRVEVLVDGGVRSGLDVLKMMSLGARACLVGRPWAWAVAVDGEAGVTHLLEILRDELAVAMGLTGTDDVAKLGADHLL